MKEDSPFFSVIIPTYNRAALIGRTLRSVLEQNFESFEVLVVDDGGKDDTKHVLLELEDNRIRYYWKENGERGAARNFGWQHAKGKFITFLDSDDVLYPGHLDSAYKFISQKKDIDCFAQAYEIKNAATGVVLRAAFQTTNSTINKELLKGNLLSCFGVFLRADIFKDLRFDEDRNFSGTEDWLLWLQLAGRHPFFYNNAITGALLEHDSRSVLSFDEKNLKYRAEHLRQMLEADKKFIQAFGSISVRKIYAHMLSYASLHLAMSRKKMKAAYYWWHAITESKRELLTRRTLAIAKKLLFS